MLPWTRNRRGVLGGGVAPLGVLAEEVKRRGGSLSPRWKCPVYAGDFGKRFIRRDNSHIVPRQPL
jgi:hypothetical protein